MASSPITSWQTEGGKVERVADFIFLGSKITVDGDCSHEIKTVAPWNKKGYRINSKYLILSEHSTIKMAGYPHLSGYTQHLPN